MKRNSKQIFVNFVQIKNRFGHFWKIKKIFKKISFRILFLGIVFLMYKEGFWTFLKQIFRFLNMKNLQIFGIEIQKIYLISRNLSLFENRKKMLNHSTLTSSLPPAVPRWELPAVAILSNLSAAMRLLTFLVHLTALASYDEIAF